MGDPKVREEGLIGMCPWAWATLATDRRNISLLLSILKMSNSQAADGQPPKDNRSFILSFPRVLPPVKTIYGHPESLQRSPLSSLLLKEKQKHRKKAGHIGRNSERASKGSGLTSPVKGFWEQKAGHRPQLLRNVGTRQTEQVSLFTIYGGSYSQGQSQSWSTSQVQA